ncbi:MAG: hypothetical protein KF836_01110 [Fimbriimonadaceae bacterium]|nr:hypothetical protein [Fimbriimonadaceae bacterium]
MKSVCRLEGLRIAFVWLLLVAAALSFAQNGVFQLESYPAVMVADGRSTLTVTAQLRDSNGSLVPDGTQVVFDSSLGSFREKIVETANGFARAILVAGDIPGTARIRATALRFNAAAELDVELVASRAQLSTAQDYIEVVGAETLWYSVQDRVLSATGADRGAKLKFQNIEIEANDLQVQVQTYEVRARKALVRIGKWEQEFETLYFRLNRKDGFGTATIMIEDDRAQTSADILNQELQKVSYSSTEPPLRPYFGMVEIKGKSIRIPDAQPDIRMLKFQDISESVSMISAKKAVAYPRKEVQFHKADVQMANQRIMQVPLFRVNVNTATPVITEQWVNVSNNSFALNYPHYLSLKPGETSLLRFKYGASYGTGTGGGTGTFLDYELNWNRGTYFDGGLIVGGIGRDDWGLGLRQTWSSSDSTILSAQVDFPAHKSMFASSNLSRQFPGFTTNLNSSYGQSLQGTRFTSDRNSLVVEKDAIKTGLIPGRIYLGFTANQSRLTGEGNSYYQQSAGARLRFVANPVRVGMGNMLNFSYSISHLSGHNVSQGLSQLASLNLAMNPFDGAFLNTTYEFTDDGFSSELLGKHKVIFEGLYNKGLVSFSGFYLQSLDVDRMSASARMRYKLGPLWRVSYGYYFDQFGPDSFLDQSYILSYRLGYRELGLSYSHRTKRLGIEILGTSID